MRFMMLLKSDEQAETGVLPDAKVVEAMVRFDNDLRNSGVLLAEAGLHPTSNGARIKFSRGKPTVTDGPFAEAKEVIAGYWLIEAKSKEEAIEWARRMFREVSGAFEANRPDASNQVGQVEVRQVYELSDLFDNETESWWREKESEYQTESSSPQAEPGRKQFIIFRKADKDTEVGAMPSEALVSAMSAYNGELMKAGVFLAGDGLQPTSKGARVYSGGKRTVIDGPFSEVKEVIAGFTLIQAESKEEAIEWAKRWPPLDGNGEVELELRQVFDASDFPPELAEKMSGTLEA